MHMIILNRGARYILAQDNKLLKKSDNSVNKTKQNPTILRIYAPVHAGKDSGT